MKNPFKDIVAGGIESAVTAVTNGASKIIEDFRADPNKVLDVNLELEKLKSEAISKADDINLQLEKVAQDNLTERNSTDMKSDSWLSKNIRPLMLIYLALACTVICILDSAKAISVSAAWITLLTSAFLSALGYYFVGRTVEKGISIKKD